MVKKPVFRTRPEAALQAKIVQFLRLRGWHVRSTHGNAYQKGYPDLLCYNKSLELYRPIDVKVEKSHRYTKAQCLEWPKWMPEEGGPGVWIMMGADDIWYQKLFQPPNMWDYWKPHYDKFRAKISDIIEPLE